MMDKFDIYFRGKTTEKMKKQKDLDEDEVISLVGSLLDSKDEFKLKIKKVKDKGIDNPQNCLEKK